MLNFVERIWILNVCREFQYNLRIMYTGWDADQIYVSQLVTVFVLVQGFCVLSK